MKLFENKKCPRCKTKMPKDVQVCPSCRLNFARFESATNAEAKKALMQGESERVLMRKGLPSDVSRLRLLLVAIFLGFLGGHNYYVGRVKRGLFFSVSFIIAFIFTLVTTFTKIDVSTDFWQVMYLLTLSWGVVIALWVIDIVKICLNKFSVPVGQK